MSKPMKKYALVTAGDIQVFSSIVGGLLSNADAVLPVEARSFSDAAYMIFDQIKVEDDRRKAVMLDEVRKPQ